MPAGKALGEWTGMRSTDWRCWKNVGPASSSAKGTTGLNLGQRQAQAGQGVGRPTVLVCLGVRGVPRTFSFKTKINLSYEGEVMWTGWVCGAA